MASLTGNESVGTNMDSLLRENRVFAPPAAFAAKAHVQSVEQYEAMYRRSIEQPDAFWSEAAAELDWFAPWTKVQEGEISESKWFVGGKLNLAHNCVDRHALGARKDKVALLWEGEPGEVRRITYGELHQQVQRLANVLKGLGVGKGDRVAIYMGMCPELAARASVRSTRSSLADSPRTPSPTASTIQAVSPC
jgi:acetyl-CoA synthetase